MHRAILNRTQTILASFCSTLLAIVLHIVPIWFLLFGPVYDMPDVFEVDLVDMQMFRERVYRDIQNRKARPPLEMMPVEIAVSIPARPEVRTKAATPRKEDELLRARAIQRTIRTLWDSMAPTEIGGALVSLNVEPDGRISEYVINRVQGNKEFQQFLATFLTALKSSVVNHGEGSGALWIECEFVIKPTRVVKGLP